VLKLQLSKESGKFLNILPPKQFRQVVKKIFSLLDDPRPNDTKELKGYPFLRCDIGEYRIVYDVAEDLLRVIVVGKRNDDEVYRGLK
jgi:mRNA interferase RelE/StbE